jgi:hypothetical protein
MYIPDILLLTCKPIGEARRPELLSSEASTGKAVNDMAAPVNSRKALKLGGSQSGGLASAFTRCGKEARQGRAWVQVC